MFIVSFISSTHIQLKLAFVSVTVPHFIQHTKVIIKSLRELGKVAVISYTVDPRGHIPKDMEKELQDMENLIVEKMQGS